MTPSRLDTIINDAIEAEQASRQVVHNGKLPRAIVGRLKQPKALRWTPLEEQYLRDNLGLISIEEIAKHLGRSRDAIVIRRKRLNLPPQSRVEGIMTAEATARLFNVDNHTVIRWIEQDLLPAWTLKGKGDGRLWRINVDDAHNFALTSERWMCFKADRITDAKLKHRVQQQMKEWGDEWLRPGQVAAMHGVSFKAVNKAIRAKTLPAVRWGNWWIRRSDARAAHFFSGRGRPGVRRIDWSDQDDVALLMAVAVGLSINYTGRLLKKGSTISYMLNRLYKERSVIVRLIREHELPIAYKPRKKALLADWQHPALRKQFPFVASALERLAGSGYLGKHQRGVVRSVLSAWCRFHLRQTRHNKAVVASLTHGGLKTSKLRAILSELQAAGVDPLRGRPRLYL